MASLREAVKDWQDELQAGIAWVAFWREGRSWSSDYIYLEMDDTLTPEDKGRLQEIQRIDPAAVVLNGYYCGYLGEDMNLAELTAGVRRHYDNGYNNIADFIEAHDNALPPEQIEEARAAAHAAGLPFSEKPYRDGDFDPYVFDGSMSVEDYELMHRMIKEERSAQMDERQQFVLEAYISNLGKYVEQEPMGEWVKFPTTAGQLKEVFDRIGIDGRAYEEWHITEYTSNIPGLAKHLNEYAHPDELNYLCALLAGQDDGERQKFMAAVTHDEYAGNLKDLINLAQNLDCYELFPDVGSAEQYGYYLIDTLETIKLPQEARHYFDFESYGGDTIINEGGSLTEQGYIYNNRSPFVEHYNGREVPQEYRVTPDFSQPTRPDPAQADMDERADGGEQAAQQAAPRPVVPILLTSENPADKMKEITGRLEQGIQSVFESERYREYLNVMSKFHDYSLNNTILIAMQGGQFVKGYKQWQTDFGRYVRAKEKGIKILAPAPYKVKRDVQKTDPETQKPLFDSDGKPIMEKQEITVPAFKIVSVFDVSQTEGKEMPPLTTVQQLSADVEQYDSFFKALEAVSPFSIGFEPLDGGKKGVCDYEGRHIAINEGMSQLQNIKTAIHEIAHAKLHNTGGDVLTQDRPDRRTREVQAESVAYVVCQHFGLDTSEYSFAYAAEWSSGKELPELKSSLETIQAAAKELITQIDGRFAELTQQRETARESEPEAAAPEQSAEQQAPLYDKLPPEQQQALSDSVKDTLQTLIDVDLKTSGEVSAGTLDAIAAQGYAYKDGQLEKQTEPQADISTTADEPEAQQPETGSTTPAYYRIDETAARRAKNANSYSDYVAGSATAEYRHYVDEAAQLAERQKARVDPMYHEKIDSLLDTYARKLAANMNSRFSIDARVPSILIAGGSNFPVRQKEKQNAARDRNWGEWQEIQGLLDKIRSTGMGGISADDPQAVVKLEKKLEKLEKTQEIMKAVNAYYRKYKTLDGCPHLSPENLEKLKAGMSSSWHLEDKPYPTWALSNNSAEIRRVKARIKDLSQKQETGFAGWEFEGGRVEANTDANRLQIFFDGKPDEATRTQLKESGFRWSPKAGAWQRQLTDNAYYSANYIKAIQPITGEKPTDLQRAHIRAQEAAQQEQPAPEPTQEQAEPDTFSIYQLKRGDETRDYRFEPYDRLQAAGLAVAAANYELIYTAPLTPDMTLESIFERFNIDRPEDFKGHSLSVSDIVVLHQDGQYAAHYVDSIGFQRVPEFLQEQRQELTPDDCMTGEMVKTPRGSFHLVSMTREHMEAAGYGVHHQSDDGKHYIMANGTQAFAVAVEQPENYLKAAEQSTEQNDNMIDGIINNTPPTPTVDELEARVQAGEQISLLDLADAIKAEQGRGGDKQGKKPSIRAQLAAAKEQAKKQPRKQPEKSNEMEV